MNAADIKEFYKKTFNTVAQGYDGRALRFFPESATRLPGYLGLQGNEKVLDVATGTGAGAVALATNLPHGQVTGIDFSEKMLAKAGAKLTAKGLHNIELLEMDMQQISLPDGHFDAATCSFALFFVDDMAEQLRHIATKVREGGKVAFTSFAENSFSPFVDIFFSSIERYGIKPPLLSWKRVSSKDQCRELMTDVGLKEITVDRVDCGYLLESPEEWW